MGLNPIYPGFCYGPVGDSTIKQCHQKQLVGSTLSDQSLICFALLNTYLLCHNYGVISFHESESKKTFILSLRRRRKDDIYGKFRLTARHHGERGHDC